MNGPSEAPESMTASRPRSRSETPGLGWRGLLFLLLLTGVGPLSVAAADGSGGRVWKSFSGYRSAALVPGVGGQTGFQSLLASETGIPFTNRLSIERSLTNQVYFNGSGVALGDVDGDGWVDVYLCGLDAHNRLYRNLGGWRFEDRTAEAGVACEGIDSSGAVLADLDGDGDLDLIVNSMTSGSRCFLNDGTGRFNDVTAVSGLSSGKSRTSMALGDVNGDGILDVYLSAYRFQALMDMPQTLFEFKGQGAAKIIDRVNRRPVTDPEFAHRFGLNAFGGIQEFGQGGDLFLGQGAGHFRQISFTEGTFLDEGGLPLKERPYDWELAVAFRDLDGDGNPDLYVCNDFETPDRFWLGDGKGHFRAASVARLSKISFFSMGVDFADINRDGFDDCFVADMLPRTHAARLSHLAERGAGTPTPESPLSRVQVARNTLLLNRGDGTFQEIAEQAGVESADWAWCPLFLDVDLDGFEDLLVSNGNGRDARHVDWVNRLAKLRVEQKLTPQGIFESRRELPPLRTANVCFRNRGDLTFEEKGHAWGLDFVGISHGMAVADLDNDGDLDLVVNHLNDPVGMYRNGSTASRIQVRLRGRGANTRGIGAKIRLAGGRAGPQQQEIIAGGRYLSSDDPCRVFAAEAPPGASLVLEVFWPSGAYSRVEQVAANTLYELSEPEPVAPQTDRVFPNRPLPARPLFVDVSDTLGHTHQDEPFDDFVRQPLLPWKLSHLGPGLSWLDLGPGHDLVLAVPTGRGGRPGLFLVETGGVFQPLTNLSARLISSRDQTTLLAWPRSNSAPSLLMGYSSYEDGLSFGGVVKRLALVEERSTDVVSGSPSSLGPMALADVDGDGDLDLFVGGRVVPGRYPLPASSRLFRAYGDKFGADAAAAETFKTIGLVSDAVFSDIDGDGDPDLLLACEWGGVRVFRNQGGSFEERTQALGLAAFTGLWNGITTADLDGDGRLDIVASNWGRNHTYRFYREKPVRLYFGEWSAPESVDLMEAGWVATRGAYAPLRMLDLVSGSLPFIRENCPTAQAYGDATLAQVLGERMEAARHVEAAWFDSTVFLNRGDHFEAHSLPSEAQSAPSFGVGVADFDGDGREDLFLSQNHFGMGADRGRLDAGVGLLLLGDGRGDFRVLPPAESGIRLPGQGRGVGVADYDRDGRADLAVAQNGFRTGLFHNTAARPGLRIRLEGPSGNPNVIGAVLRCGPVGTPGPAREIHAGGGYWSQNDPVQVLGVAGEAQELRVRWPGGLSTTVRIPAGAMEVRVTASGELQVTRPFLRP